MGFWKKFKGFFRTVYKGARKAFVPVFGVEALRNLTATTKSMLTSSLGAIVEQVVTELKYENLSNAEKREEAYRRIYDRATSEGVEFKESYARLLIELVVQRLRGVS
jgi:hypothetical protein